MPKSLKFSSQDESFPANFQIPYMKDQRNEFVFLRKLNNLYYVMFINSRLYSI